MQGRYAKAYMNTFLNTKVKCGGVDFLDTLFIYSCHGAGRNNKGTPDWAVLGALVTLHRGYVGLVIQ